MEKDLDLDKYSLASIVTDAIVEKYGSMNEFQMLALSGKIDFFKGLHDVIYILRTTYEIEDKNEQDKIDEELLFIDMIITRLIDFINKADIKNYKKYNIDFDLSKNVRVLNENQIKHVYYFFKKFIHILTVDEWYSYLVYLYTNLKIYINYNPIKYKFAFDILELIENSDALPSAVSSDGEYLATLYCSSTQNIKEKLTYVDFYLENVSDEYKNEGIIIDDDQKNNQVVTNEDLQAVYDLKSTRIISMYDPMLASKITATAKKAYEGIFNIHDENMSDVNEIEVPISCDNVPDKKLDQKDLSEKRKAEAKDFMAMAMEEVICAESVFEVHRAFQTLSHGTATTANIDLKNMFSIYLHILKLAEALLKKPDMESFNFPSDIRLQFNVMKPELLPYNFRFIRDWFMDERCKMDTDFRKAFCAAAYILFEVAEKEEFSKMLHDTALELGSFDYQLTTTIKINKFKIRTIKEIVADVNKGINKAISECEAYTRFRYACDYFAKTDSSGYSIEVNINDGIVIKIPHLTASLNLLLSDHIRFDDEIGLLEVDVLKYNASYEKDSMFNATIQNEILNEVEKLLAFCNVHIGMDKYHRSNIMAGSSGVLVRDKDNIIDITKLDYTSAEGLMSDIKKYEIMIHKNLGILFKVLINLVALMMKQHNSAQ